MMEGIGQEKACVFVPSSYLCWTHWAEKVTGTLPLQRKPTFHSPKRELRCYFSGPGNDYRKDRQMKFIYCAFAKHGVVYSPKLSAFSCLHFELCDPKILHARSLAKAQGIDAR